MDEDSSEDSNKEFPSSSAAAKKNIGSSQAETDEQNAIIWLHQGSNSVSPFKMEVGEIRVPASERISECPICKKIFRGKQSKKMRDTHMEIHSVMRKYACPHCPVTFRQDRPRRTHIKRVHLKLKPYKCEFCSLMWASPQERDTHQRVRIVGV
jgi:hypothetical protein